RSPMHQIDVNDSSVNAGWIFYTTRWINYPLFIRVLNPEQDRKENAIRKNQSIYIKRIIVEESKAHETD
ncbi:TssN family type VI secretion system protein, partial [Prevotella disiens]|uniref:TssN family type VI secretion system protein n=1 Tax=Prevotella disiens TaxID=28130 RepID=UPI00058B042E